MSDQAVRVRFAPSPTGHLHVGGARTLFFNWLFAKKAQGVLVVRIEDTDQVRSTRQSEEKILADIKRLGLDYQEGPGCEGPYAPYRQSERLRLYSMYAQKFFDEGRAYPCFCSDELLTQKREAALKMGRVPHYDGTCAKLSRAESIARQKAGERAGLRFRVPQKAYILEDHVRGRVEFKEGMVGDFFITRTPTEAESKAVGTIGFPVYNFCCVIDDHLMKITHVIRAEEHLSNTVRQMILYEALGFKPPEYVHISLVLGADKQKLSKRSGDVSVFEYLEKGYLPEALLNFLVLLGWSPPSELKPVSQHPEIFSLEEMIESFNFEHLQKSPGVFDVQKLKWMNSYYIRHLPIGEIVQRARRFFETSNSQFRLSSHSAEWFEGVVSAVRGEVSLLSELPSAAAVFLEGIPSLEKEAQIILQGEGVQKIITSLITQLKQESGDLKADEIEKMIKIVAQETGVKGRNLFMPIRAIITGKTHGPELKNILPLLGRETTLKRIEGLKVQAFGTG